MKHIKLLDCTLRDGGYLVDTVFGDTVIKGIIKKLCMAKVDSIEVGFLKNVDHKKGSSTFSRVEEITQYLPNKIDRGNTSFIAMIDYGRYSIESLSEYDGESIDTIRDCYFKKDIYNALKMAEEIIKKGYKVYIQPVDVLGYSDIELLDLIKKVNKIKPYALSIVDTFGSMYKDDLQRIFSLIDYNLDRNIKIGFHSHNNLQLSFSLAQDFAMMSLGKREIVIDGTINGMGRGAGNTNTELVMDFLNRKLGYHYDMNEMLDLIDSYMPKIMQQCSWGYSIPYFIAGMYNSHVHNINYLMDKHNIKSKDMRLIIEEINPQKRKRYDYDNLEQLYVNYFDQKIDDIGELQSLEEEFLGRKILIIAPGRNSQLQKEKIIDFIEINKPIVISTNYINKSITPNYAFYSSKKRYEESLDYNEDDFKKINKILTSNVKVDKLNNEKIINFKDLAKVGWKYFDNSTILLLRLLNKLKVKDIYIAGFDGFFKGQNYSKAHEELESYDEYERYIELNRELKEMLIDFKNEISNDVNINFITESKFENIFEKESIYI
ncbi:4-hydroxy-2-oxovalerate aldolase [Terrisporobacter petrolearius]|uniref:4-hydroxy-2-oxovalerate aldolase n=1 Tax=Terrisporobacter petrolearius TaxID=1460447 RepID=A0ABZ3FCE6_9FIRM